MVVGLQVGPALDLIGLVEPDPRRARPERGGARRAADDRHHHRARGSLRRWSNGGSADRQFLGRSRGGRPAKLHVRANAAGLPLGLVLTPVEAHDVNAYDAVMNEPGPDPKVLLADRGYDASAVRADVESRGGTPVIPTKRNRKVHVPMDRHAHAVRNRIERIIGRIKNVRRVATRHDKTAASFLGFVQLTAIRLWLRHFVNTV